MADRVNAKFGHPHTSKWVKGTAIGTGSFGVVNLAMNKSTGKLFVVKSATVGAGGKLLQNEAKILLNLDSPYVVRCLGHDMAKGQDGMRMFNLFMEHMAGGSLSDILKKFGGALDETVIRSYTQEILQGLAYLHERRIVHCDIKCKNVLLGSSGNVKLADFGAAQRFDSLNTNEKTSGFWQSMCGTPLWMAPEVLRNEALDCSADIWSLGCTIIEMATGGLPWGDEVSNPMAMVYKIACNGATPPLPPTLSKEGLDFLSKCLQRDPSKRWTSKELLNHPFVCSDSDEECEDSISPTSILDMEWDSDGSEATMREELMCRVPFSKRFDEGDWQVKSHAEITTFESSDDWFEVR